MKRRRGRPLRRKRLRQDIAGTTNVVGRDLRKIHGFGRFQSDGSGAGPNLKPLGPARCIVSNRGQENHSP